MNPRTAINFFRSPVGAFAGFCALVFVALTVANGFKHPNKEHSSLIVPSAAGAETKPQVVQSVQKEMQPYNPPQPKPERAPAETPKK